jgi:hypothetical protein
VYHLLKRMDGLVVIIIVALVVLLGVALQLHMTRMHKRVIVEEEEVGLVGVWQPVLGRRYVPHH